MAMDFPASPTIGQTFTSTNGQTYTWSGSAWRVLVPGSQMSRTIFTATSGQTTFSMNYTPGFIDVFRNGVKLVNGSDFTATNATSIVLVNACNVGDTLEVLSLAQVAYTDAAKAEDVYSVVRGFKNRIINGGMDIDQRNNGASGTAVACTVDRWQYYGSQASKLTWGKNLGGVTPPAGFANYLGFSSSSAYSVLSTDGFILYQKIEGYNVSDLDFGKGTAKSLTVSFWVRSSLTGTFGAALLNGPDNRSYPFSYNINSANTWEFKTVSMTADTTGTWYTDNQNGLSLAFSLGTGSTKNAAAGSWVTGQYWGATGGQSIVGTNGATFYITGVQLEVGAVTNPVFERRAYGQELALCYRYYWRYRRTTGGNEPLGNSVCWVANDSRIVVYAPVTMRAAPTVATANGTNFFRFETAGTIYNVSSLTAQYSSPTSTILFTTTSGSAAGNGGTLYLTNDSAYIEMSAEL